MNNLNDKIWFVYMGDHHEGPVSLLDLRSRLESNQISVAHYVWREGMDDWKAMTEVAECSQIMAQAPASVPSIHLPAQTNTQLSFTATGTGTGTATQEIPVEHLAIQEKPPSLEVPHEGMPTGSVAFESGPDVEIPTELTPEPQSRSLSGIANVKVEVEVESPSQPTIVSDNSFRGVSLKPPIGLITLVALLGILGWVIHKGMLPTSSISMLRAIPGIGSLFSTLPEIPDINPQDRQSLEAAASSSTEAPRAAFALSTQSPETPSFHIASNLPDGTGFEIVAVGKTGTLLNQFEYQASTRGTLQKHYVKTVALRGRSPLPRGEYTVYLYESKLQPPETMTLLQKVKEQRIKLPDAIAPGRKIIEVKTLFLGGAKDASYLGRLNTFHKKLQDRAKKELDDLRNFYAILRSQLDATSKAYSSILKNKTAKKRASEWSRFSGKWSALDREVLSRVNKWTPQFLERGFFYGPLFEMTRLSAQSVSRVHHVQTPLIQAKKVSRAQAQDMDATESTSRDALERLRARIDETSKLSLTETGMPQRIR